VNVIGVKPGADSAERVVVSAHYDHIEGCEGADDDASGIAGVLETARVLASGRFARTLVVACWDEEEFGMIGSAAWVARTKERGETVVASFVYEMIGFASSEPGSQTFPPGIELVFRRQLAWLEARESRGDFIGLLANGSAATAVARLEAHAATFELPAMSLALPDAMTDLPFLSDFRRSDHAPFWAAGWPAVRLGDTADFRYPQYHCVAGPDVPELLDMEFATRVVRTVTAAAADLLGPLTP
jgi:Zn-dependent M28 family amino/carboxypeptidase